MRAVLLAAGLGTRLLPLTQSIPKCLVSINDRPLLDYWIELLSNAGISEILINLHHLPDKVQEYVAKCKYPVNITLVMEDQLLLTGGTILKNKTFYQNEPVIVIHADNLSIFNVGEFIDRFNSRPVNIEMTMMTYLTDSPTSCGILELDNLGHVIAMHEKSKFPPGNLANGAVYILSNSVLDLMTCLRKEKIDFSTEILPCFMGRINTFLNSNYHRDIGTFASLELAQLEYPKALRKFKPNVCV